MTADTLKSYSCKDLAEMAKRHGVRGWHSMRKDQLVQTLARLTRNHRSKQLAASARKAAATPTARGATRATTTSIKRTRRATVAPAAARPTKTAQVARKIQEAKGKLDRLKNISTTPPDRPENGTRDRLVVMVRDPYWLHAYWELSRQGVARAAAAMNQEWHAARPILRLLKVSSAGTSRGVESLVRDIPIHGGVNNWYVDVPDPPQSFRLDIGYLAPSGKFFVLAHSNVVSTPAAGVKDAIDENWADVAENFEKIYAMSGGYSHEGCSEELQELFEERLRRPMGTSLVGRVAAEGLIQKRKGFDFSLDAELIVYGSSEPDARVTLQGEPVRLRSDGTFTVRFSLPNSRQVIPAVACSADGVEQRTIVLAVERNTKVMEPLIRGESD